MYVSARTAGRRDAAAIARGRADRWTETRTQLILTRKVLLIAKILKRTVALNVTRTVYIKILYTRYEVICTSPSVTNSRHIRPEHTPAHTPTTRNDRRNAAVPAYQCWWLAVL